MVSAEDLLPLAASAVFVNKTQAIYLQIESHAGAAARIRDALLDGRVTTAAEMAREALRHTAGDPLFTYLLAIAQVRAGRPDDARSTISALEGIESEAVRLLNEQMSTTGAHQ
jgi:Flp pilus assembly protein TadD